LSSKPINKNNVDEILKLKKQLKKEKHISKSYLNQLKYLQADFDNYRKSIDRQIDDKIMFYKQDIILNIIEIKEDIERAVDNSSHNIEELNSGLKMINNNLDKMLKTTNVTEIVCKNKFFDPIFHEIVSTSKKSEMPDNLINKVIRKGYVLGNKVLRHSLVEIIKNN